MKSHGFPVTYTYRVTTSSGATTTMPRHQADKFTADAGHLSRFRRKA